jgi:hypothetical protein
MFTTRRLMVLSVLCGLAILLAGGLWLVQASRAADEVKPALVVGESTSVQGTRYTLVDAERSGSQLLFTLALSDAEAARSVLDEVRVLGRGGRVVELIQSGSIRPDPTATFEMPPDEFEVQLTAQLEADDTTLFVSLRRQGGGSATWSLASLQQVTSTTAG